VTSEIIKKVRVPKASLPNISVDNEGYVLRYRIISEDRNRFSHWSPISFILPGLIYTNNDGNVSTNNNITHTRSGDITTIVWESVSINTSSSYIEKAKEYDVWLLWNRSGDGTSGDWKYEQRVQGNSISVITPSTYTINGVDQAQVPDRLRVEVYLPEIPVTRSSTFLKLYSGGPYNV